MTRRRISLVVTDSHILKIVERDKTFWLGIDPVVSNLSFFTLFLSFQVKRGWFLTRLDGYRFGASFHKFSK